jgi:hypothetical protein
MFFLSPLTAVDLTILKDDIMSYIESLDHPNREVSNKFSKNLAIAQKAENVHMTIYTAELAMVWEEKNVSINKPGNVKIMYSDVPSKVDLSSVSMVFDNNVTLFSQKYAYDVVNLFSLLRRYKGKYILYIDKENDKKQKRATLLAIDPIIVKDLKTGNIFTPHKIFFENIPEDMAVTPTLFWDVYTKAKELCIKLEYLTDGISWKSDYNIYVRNYGEFDMNSWITISNNSGTSFKDVNITIVTGDVRRAIREDINSSKKVVSKAVEIKQPKDKTEYALYQVPYKDTINNKEEKQIAFVRGKGIKYKEYLLHDRSYDLSEHNISVLHFSRVLAFENTQENHLGMGLPQGIVRVYSYDSLSNKRFSGATDIGNIKENETVELSIGDTNDVIGEEKMIILKKSEEKEQIRYKIKLKNTLQRKIMVKLKRSIKEKIGDVTIKDSCQKQCEKKKLSDLSILYTIMLEPEQVYALNISYYINKKVNILKEN